MVQRASSMTMHAVIVVIQKKVRSYVMWIKRRFDSPYHKSLWMFSFSFRFYYLCSSHCSSSSKSFLVITMLISYYIGMYSTHCNLCTCIVHQFMANNTIFIYGFIFYLSINGVSIVMFFNGLCFSTFICLVFLVVGFSPLLFYIHDFSSFSSN
jgi:hypothetical protein